MDILPSLLDYDPNEFSDCTVRIQTRPARQAKLINPLPLRPSQQPKRRTPDPDDHLPPSVVSFNSWKAVPPRKKPTPTQKLRQNTVRAKKKKPATEIVVPPMISPLTRPKTPRTPPRMSTPPPSEGRQFIACNGTERFSPTREIPDFIPFSVPTVFYHEAVDRTAQRKQRYQNFKSKSNHGQKCSGKALRNKHRAAKHQRRLFY